LVADEIVGRVLGSVPCPAAVLVDGELRRRGLRTTRGRLDPDFPGQETTWLSTADGTAAIGVATRATDRRARLAARSVLSAWLTVTQPRTVLLRAPDSILGGTDHTDLVLVVGSAEPNAASGTPRHDDPPVHLIDTPDAIRPQWLIGAETVSLTASASATPDLLSAVITALGGLGTLTIRDHQTPHTRAQVMLPSPVRRF